VEFTVSWPAQINLAVHAGSVYPEPIKINPQTFSQRNSLEGSYDEILR